MVTCVLTVCLMGPRVQLTRVLINVQSLGLIRIEKNKCLYKGPFRFYIPVTNTENS